MDATHDPALRAWVESANEPGSDFPIQNLPFGVFSRTTNRRAHRVGVAIGDAILDLATASEADLLSGVTDETLDACRAPTLNALMALAATARSSLRGAISALLRSDSKLRDRTRDLGDALLVPMRDAILHVPAAIGDYTDFYASIHHARNVGSMFRPDNPLLPNYKYVPIAYHGRASSIVGSGTAVRRPNGQTKNEQESAPRFGASARLDYECEVGVFVGPGTKLGEPILIGQARSHIFGLCLVNDWSARDIQTWEYQPLGPFLAKSFATTVSPWVVTLEALEPYRVPAFTRAEGDPRPLPYLDAPDDRERGGIDITLEVLLVSAKMREAGMEPVRLSRASFASMYWTVAQMVAHHASNGCNLREGDLLASGTVSGEAKDARGCLLERTWRGTEPLELPTGETRRFLEDGDEVIMRGWCERAGLARIGFGECRGVVLPAVPAT